MTLNAEAVIRYLSTDVGERFGGSPGDAKAAAFLVDAFSTLGCAVRVQEFSFIGWRPGAPPRLRLLAPEEHEIPCAPLLYSASTTRSAVRGRLARHGTAFLIPGVYELPAYSIIGSDGYELGRIICEMSGPPISLINPRPLFQLPQVVVGSGEQALLERLLEGSREVEAELFVEGEILPSARTRNVIASYRGAGTDSRVVVCAHADTTLNTPGAYDNASGIGGLYEVASRIIASRLPLNVDFVAFACEEQGFYGASYLVNDLKERDELSAIRYVVNLDQISGGDFLWVWVGPEEFARAVKTVLDGVPALGDYHVRLAEPMPGADDWTFHVEGIPTVSLIFWRLEDYHKPTDGFDKVDMQKVMCVVEAAYRVLEQLRDNRQP